MTSTPARFIEKWETTDLANAQRRAKLTINWFFQAISPAERNLVLAEDDLLELEALVAELRQRHAHEVRMNIARNITASLAKQ
jgi:hypothetical protein